MRATLGRRMLSLNDTQEGRYWMRRKGIVQWAYLHWPVGKLRIVSDKIDQRTNFAGSLFVTFSHVRIPIILLQCFVLFKCVFSFLWLLTLIFSDKKIKGQIFSRQFLSDLPLLFFFTPHMHSSAFSGCWKRDWYADRKVRPLSSQKPSIEGRWRDFGV